MKMYFFRGDVPNFGDELNHWLLPRIFPDFFDEDPSTLFLGIGSVLFDYHAKESRKVVFGSGYGGYTALPEFDENWHIHCVRGPRTAEMCGISADKVAGDAAILIRRFRARAAQATIPCSFMPHWESIDRGNWELACRIAGIHLIDPRKPAEDVLRDIEASSLIITEAMHGAIVADALRVPWIPILPFHKSHWMKWFDWAEALDVNLTHHRIWPSSTQEAWVARMQRPGQTIRNLRPGLAHCVGVMDWAFVRMAAARLKVAARQEPTLSSDTAILRATERLEASAAQILRKYAPQ